MNISRLLLLLLILPLLNGCGREAPECNYKGRPMQAPSAGCLVVQGGRLLLVETIGIRWGPPGGSVERNESAQCAAERETWEETGIEVRAMELAHQFDNGFRLFWCAPMNSTTIDVHRPLEVFDANWFAPDQFKDVDWRFPEQDILITEILRKRVDTRPIFWGSKENESGD